MKKRTKEEQAAYMRAYRAQKKREAAGVERVEIDTGTQDVTMYDAAGSLVRTVTYAERLAAEKPKPAFLVAPNDDCIMCGHPWHNEEDGCRAWTGHRTCGCKLYASAAEPPL